MSASPIQNIELKYWVVKRADDGMLITWLKDTPKEATACLRGLQRMVGDADELVLQQITRAAYDAIVAAHENRVMRTLIVDPELERYDA
jgi:hypothetical protein